MRAVLVREFGGFQRLRVQAGRRPADADRQGQPRLPVPDPLPAVPVRDEQRPATVRRRV